LAQTEKVVALTLDLTQYQVEQVSWSSGRDHHQV